MNVNTIAVPRQNYPLLNRFYIKYVHVHEYV